MEFRHKPVMLTECIEGLNIKPDGVYVDGTLGGGGHAIEVCKRLSKRGMFIGIDRDIDAIHAATRVLSDFSESTMLVRGNFFNTDGILDSLGIGAIDGLLLDLGISSYQVDDPERGFSYMHDGPLDMRMDRAGTLSAYDVVNGYGADKLCKVIFEYGEERWAKRIARFIVDERESKPIATTFELVSVIKRAVPAAAREGGPHPAKRTFQAIRIEVNGELAELGGRVSELAGRLERGGRLCVITFHSLEDRIIKNTFRRLEDPCTCPKELPTCVCGKEPVLKIVTKKPISPGETEIEGNPRARSAKLRIAEKL